MGGCLPTMNDSTALKNYAVFFGSGYSFLAIAAFNQYRSL
ncbi:hypothetical protein Zymop_1635 [Zymomonas mobilis subsp. pomaceae ATCC 29192]|uniref:Uncharacterized protein n=1 Tax=Zymomonas mobilis subsp. pomaceae (strain ATCC 29192 / DSM 22645 / JCM 10191 / CCUG 17912 / NBRC 13757 / NCIMB 11200 / NRRL B-4491 / Barker I) TaxID=579138 RepID=F8EWB4_ZYMMT|nr:hypothetical protein Zymop_1635 [Zymomonas mobilis subsp. pomaceae ATCC 29192]